MTWKAKYFIVYPYSMCDKLNWPNDFMHRCPAKMPVMLQHVLKDKGVGSEIKLIWNEHHRWAIIKDLQITNKQLNDYLYAQCSMLSFKSIKMRTRASNALRKMNGYGFIELDNYRDVVLYQARFFNLSKWVKNYKNGKTVYLEDSVLWYCLDMGTFWYLSLPIHERINYKQSYYQTINTDKIQTKVIH